MSSMQGTTIFITGAARGIGAATARGAAARGARVALAGMEPERLKALAEELGAPWFECDVTDQRALDRAVAGTVKARGGIDVVVANAGIANNGTVATNSADAVARTIEVNLVGVTRTVSATLPHVTERRGYYLLVSSAAALRPIPGMAAYSASKIGVEYFGDALRLELAHKGVAVGTAHPSWIDTDLVRDMQRDSPSFRELLPKLPYPLNFTSTVETCVAAFLEGIEKRKRKIFVPAALAPIAAMRSLLQGGSGTGCSRGRRRSRWPSGRRRSARSGATSAPRAWSRCTLEDGNGAG